MGSFFQPEWEGLPVQALQWKQVSEQSSGISLKGKCPSNDSRRDAQEKGMIFLLLLKGREKPRKNPGKIWLLFIQYRKKCGGEKERTWFFSAVLLSPEQCEYSFCASFSPSCSQWLFQRHKGISFSLGCVSERGAVQSNPARQLQMQMHAWAAHMSRALKEHYSLRKREKSGFDYW